MDSTCLALTAALVIVTIVVRIIRSFAVYASINDVKSVTVKYTRGDDNGGTAESTKPPGYHSDGAGAFDLRAAEDVVIQPVESHLLNTSVRLEIPNGHAGFIKGRSSLAKRGVWCFEGLVDSDYRGEISVQLRNNNNYPYVIEKNERIAQVVIMEYVKANLLRVNSPTEFTETRRGAGGFGSTGLGSDDFTGI